MASSDQPNLIQRELQKAETIVKNEVLDAAHLVNDGVRSYAYLYPLRGILLLLTTPSLLNSVKPVLLKSLGLSTLVLVAMFFFTYFPLVAALAFVSGPLAFIGAIPVVLAETRVVSVFFSKFLFQAQGDKLFDAVLVLKGHEDLVQRGRTISFSASGVRTLGKSLLRPVGSRFSTEGLIRYILSIPLNSIPLIGSVLFLLLNGENAGPSSHVRYFQLKRMSSEEQSQFVTERKGAYTLFGVTSIALGLVPIVGTVLSFTSVVGAALWAADLEDQLKRSQGGSDGDGQVNQEKVKRVEIEVGHGGEEL